MSAPSFAHTRSRKLLGECNSQRTTRMAKEKLWTTSGHTN